VVNLTEAVSDPARRAAIVAAAVKLVEEEVAGKRGLTGAAVRTAFAAFQRVRPGIVTAAVERLLPEFATVLDPHWAQAVSSGDPDRWFRSHDRSIAHELLGVTDRLAGRSSNRVLVRLYQSLRGSALDHVAVAVPRLPSMIRAQGVASGPVV
jgi:hypothetical protein